MDWTLEVIVLPVSDIDRAKAFYSERAGFGWMSTCGPPTAYGSSS